MKSEQYLHTAVIGIGSNLGDKKGNIRQAIRFMDSDKNCRVLKLSSVYETKPFGFEHESNFLNAVLKLETNYTVRELFGFLKGIEEKLGRRKAGKWEAREIDLDILFYDAFVYSDESLKIPHKGITERDFVIVPLKEIEPDLIHPELKKKIADIRTDHLKKNIIRKFPEKIL